MKQTALRRKINGGGRRVVGMDDWRACVYRGTGHAVVRTVLGRCRAMRTRKTEVAVIGLGAMGAAALYQLARRGVGAIGIDRFDPPHDQGSTHGETRVTRVAVGEGAQFVPLVRRSHEIWREIEHATGETLLVTCGEVLIGREDSSAGLHQRPGFFRQARAVAERFGIPYEMLDRNALAARFPQFANLVSDDAGLFEPDGGFVHVERCVGTQLAEARRLGAEVEANTVVTGIAQFRGGVRIATGADEILADQAIVAAGAWTAPLLGPPFDRLLRVTRQVLYWFEADEPALYGPDACPAFIRMTGPGNENMFYGVPTPAGATGIKLGTEQFTHATAADCVVREVREAEIRGFHDQHVAPFLRSVSSRLIRAKACLYTETADANFIIDRVPGHERVHVISACSGHGFKHSAAIGEAVAARVAGDRTGVVEVLEPFALRG